MSEPATVTSTVLIIQHMKDVTPDPVITRPTLLPHLRLVFQDLNPVLYPAIRFIPTDLINIVTEYAVVDESSITVTFIPLVAHRMAQLSGGDSLSFSNEGEIRLFGLKLMMNDLYDHLRDIHRGQLKLTVTSTDFQTRVADQYDATVGESDFLQEEATHLSPELVFQSNKQRSAYILYEAYRRVIRAGQNPEEVLPPMDIKETCLFEEGDDAYDRMISGYQPKFPYSDLAAYSAILFGDIHAAIYGIHGVQHNKFVYWRSYRETASYDFMTLISENDPVTGRIQTCQFKGRLNQLYCAQMLPNPFSPGLTYPSFFNQLIQEEEAERAKLPLVTNQDLNRSNEAQMDEGTSLRRM